MIILIADDENLVRLGLKKIIKDTDLENVEILEARNGHEMLTTCQNTPPDLAFVDIKMPLLSGLEAIEEAKKFCPDTTWIMLTGFSEFKFAQNAISLGVRDYLLKPLEPEKIRKILLDIQATVQQKHINSNHLFELQVSNLFNSPQTTRDSEEFSLPSGQVYTAIHFYEGYTSRQNDFGSLYTTVVPRLRQWLSSWRSPEDHFALFCLQTGLICLVSRASAAQTRRIFACLSRPPMTELLSSTAVFFCQSGSGIRELFRQSNSLQELLPLTAYMKKNAPYDYKAVQELWKRENALSFAKCLEHIMQAYLDKDEIRYQKYLERLQNTPGGRKLYSEFSAPILDCLSQVLHFSSSPSGYDHFCRLLHEHSRNMYQKSAAAQPDIIKQIKDYIEINYANDVSIISLAETFNLAPTYLSKIFHEKAGKKLIDYVMEVRIKNAKRLMTENPDILIKNVALLVGYYSTRHFKDVFQKQTGMLPSEFQKQLKKGI